MLPIIYYYYLFIISKILWDYNNQKIRINLLIKIFAVFYYFNKLFYRFKKQIFIFFKLLYYLYFIIIIYNLNIYIKII